MAYNTKEIHKKCCRKAKRRVQIYLKQGMTIEAADLKKKIERSEKEYALS